MAAENDNAPPLPTPAEFSTLLAEYTGAHERALETVDDRRAAEALRMRLIEIYERAVAHRLRRGVAKPYSAVKRAVMGSADPAV
jgi:hypothetical protein